MAEESNIFKDIDYNNKAIPVPVPDRLNSIDTDNEIIHDIIDAIDYSCIDLSRINSFTNISQSRDQVYNLIDMMCEDPVISTALSIYTSDVCEVSDIGNIVWAESDDDDVLGMVNYLLDKLEVGKHIHEWAGSLIKYGDIYLRLYRKSEYDKDLFAEFRDKDATLNEAIILKAFKDDDVHIDYVKLHKNPAEVFELQRFGKTAGYIRSHINTYKYNSDDVFYNYNNVMSTYNFNRGDVDIFTAVDYVHGVLEGSPNRVEEEVNIINTRGELGTTDSDIYTYSVRRGQSLFYNTFKIWRELSLLENAVLLNRLTKSAIVRIVSIEVGDMERSDIRALLQRVKSMIEQKAAINIGNSYSNYVNPGAMENIIYTTTHDGVGAITTSELGGEVNVGDLADLDYFKNKLFGSLGIPKQFLGDTDDSTGFNGGTSLALVSSQFAKTIKLIQSALCQAITDAINILLLDRGLNNYVNEFTIRMQAPTTIEEKDRKENMSSTLSNISTIMGMLDDVESKAAKLKILKSQLSASVNDATIVSILQDEITRLETEGEETDGEEEDEFGDFVDEGFDEDMSTEGGSVNTDFADLAAQFGGSNEAVESLKQISDKLITESEEQEISNDELPSFEELGINYF